MPDPGEPHPPRPDHYGNMDAYLRAFHEYTELISPPHEVEIGLEAAKGFLRIQQYLKENSGP